MTRLLITTFCLFFAPLMAGTPPAETELEPEPGAGPAEKAWTAGSNLTGAWGGLRDRLAQDGLSIDLNGIHSFQGVADGGLDLGNRTGNVVSGNLGLTLDTEKAGLWPGGTLKVRLEGRAGDDVLIGAGATSPVNNQAIFPLVESRRGQEAWALTELVFTQFFTEQIGIVGGLNNTTYGDNNPITGDAISNQHFMNMGFLYSPVESHAVPAVTLGGGILLRPVEGVLGSLTVVGSEETAGYNPFDLYEGTTFATEWEFEYEVGGKPGGMVVGGLYSINQARVPFGGNPRLVLEEFAETGELETTKDSWAVFWNGFQYLSGDEERGTGLFARLGLSDGDPNPVRWHGAVGVGGVGLLPGREFDRWGMGVYYQNLTEGVLSLAFGLDDEIGAEVFYNIALTPWLNVTLDAQVIDSAVPQAGTAVVLGTRVAIRF
jgi:porin